MNKYNKKRTKWKELYNRRLRQKGFLYDVALVWIVIKCFLKHFFTKTSRWFRYGSMTVVCTAAFVLVLLFFSFHSFMDEKSMLFSLQIETDEVETEEGYDQNICCNVILNNDGECDLEGVSLHLGEEQDGFSLVFQNGEVQDGILAAGDRWEADVVSDPGKKPGEYPVTVVAEIQGTEDREEQVILFTVKPGEKPEKTEEPERPEVTPEITKEPEITKLPETSKEPEVTENPEIPKKTGTAEDPETTNEPEITGKPGDSDEQGPTRLPEVFRESGKSEIPESSPIPIVSKKPEFTIHPAATVLPVSDVEKAAKPAQESKMNETDKEKELVEDVIRVDVPVRVHMWMNPMASDRNRQITSRKFPLKNESKFPVEVKISDAVLDIRQNGGWKQKNCSLNMDIWKQKAVVLAIRNLREGQNSLETSFALEADDTAYIQFSGSLDKGTEYLWKDGDLSTRIKFEFTKKGNTP